VTELFDTRKTVNQQQGGVAVEHSFSLATTLRVTGYGGWRKINQYLAFPGAGATSSGGVVDLDRNYGGFGARLIRAGDLAGAPFTLSVGADGDRMHETRQGFVNDNGVSGTLRRDEDDTVTSTDAYAEAQWRALPALSLTLGVRTSRVRFESVDRYIVGPNPDDSGSRTYTNTSPIAGAVWHAADTLNVYTSYGRGFETPTFAELAYRPVGTGLNLSLDPAIASSWEAGLKWFPRERQRINLAAFAVDTKQEIVVDTAGGGRTTFRNAGKTKRRGIEAEWGGELGGGITAYFNYTWLRAEFAESYFSGSPPMVVPAGTRLPGVPPQQAYGVVTWAPGGLKGLSAAAEVQHVGRIYVNDRNTAAAPAYTIANARLGFLQTAGNFKFSEYIRVNNLTNRNYAGSVIVNDAGGRYFEPAPERNWYAGVSVSAAF
jgi:iron complex outermembrane receptor protein